MSAAPRDDMGEAHPTVPAPPAVLLVDEAGANLATLRDAVRSEAVELLYAQSATEGFHLLRDREVALAVVNLCLPGTDGFRFAELLRGSECTRHVPLIFITASGEEEKRTFQGYEAGAVDYLYLPINPEMLRGKVRVFLDLNRQRQELLRQRDALQTALDDQQRTQAQLQAGEERYRLALAATRDAVWVWNVETDSQVWNQAGADLFGWTDIVEQPQSAQWWVDRVHPEDRDRVGRVFHAALADPSVTRWADEYRFLKRDGSYAWVLDRGYLVRDERGLALRAVGAMQDISERKRAQEVSSHLAAVVGSSFDAIVSQTLDGLVTSWNAAAERMFGYSAAEMIGHTVYRLIPPELQNEEPQILERISRGESIHHYETLRVTKDGRRLDLSLTISPIKDSEGRITGVSKIARDVTEQTRQRAALSESEERFRALADQMSQLAWMMDETGWVYWFNQRWYEYTGTTFETMQGWGWQQVHHPDHRERVIVGKRRSIETGEPWDETFPLRGKDGEYRWFLTRAVPIRDGRGRIVRWFGTNTDITDRKRAEEELRARERLLNAVFKQQFAFSALLTTEGRVVRISDSVARNHQGSALSPEQLVGSRFVDAPWWRDEPATLQEWTRQLAEAPAHAGPVRGEGAYRLPDGTWRYSLNSVTALRDEKGQVEYLLAEGVDITPQKLAERALRESETRFRELVDRSPFGIYVVDAEFRIAHMNEAGQQGAFHNVRPVIGRDFGEAMRTLWPEPVAAEIIGLFRRTLDTGIPYRSRDFVNPRADVDQTEGYEWELHRLTLPDGRHGVVCYYYDSTRLKMAESALRESGERLRSAMAAGDMGAWDIDLATGAVTWDAQQYHIFGLSPERSPVDMDAFWRLVHPDDLERAKQAAAEAERSGRFAAEFRIIRPDGGVRWIAGRGAVVAHGGNGSPRMIGINYDVTERKRHESLSAEQRHLLELIATNRPIGECLEALTGAVTRLEPNARAALLTVDAERSAMTHTFSAFLPPSFGQAISGAPVGESPIGTCGTAIFTGLPITCPNVEREGPWSSMWRTLCLAHGIKACHSQPVFGHEGKAIASFFVCLAEAREPNAWERRLAEFGAHLAGIVLERDRVAKALRESQERLQAAAAELEKRVAERTKDLSRSQADLRALATELNLAEQRERKRLAGELHDHLQQMLVYGKLQVGHGKRQAAEVPACAEAMDKVDSMLSEALTYTRTLVAELSPPVLREHGLAAGLRWLAEYMERLELTVTVAAPDEPGPALPEDRVMLLFQSVRELLVNVSKHAGTGKAELVVSQEDDALTIVVRDSGQGFDLAAAAAAAAEQPRGGLSSKFGLFSIRERMQAMGGAFTIQSAPGQGTTATLILPFSSDRAQDERAVETAGGRSARANQPAPQSRTIRVLLVDDHKMVRQGLRAVLEAYPDIELVGEASNGEEAVAMAERLQPAAIVMDISMPRMNGIQATGLITSRHPGMQVIGLSVNAGEENQTAMLRAGAYRLLTKEAAVEQLYGAIKEAVTSIRPRPLREMP